MVACMLSVRDSKTQSDSKQTEERETIIKMITSEIRKNLPG